MSDHKFEDSLDFEYKFDTPKGKYFIVDQSAFDYWPLAGEIIQIGTKDIEYFRIVKVSKIISLSMREGDIGLHLWPCDGSGCLL